MLWNRQDLETLQSFAIGNTPYDLSPDGVVKPERWTIRFPPAQPKYLAEGTLRSTYTSKPLVAPFHRPLFGELAVLECLQRDGWNGVWVDTFHSRFWDDMPHQSSRVELQSLAPKAWQIYDGIVKEHGKRGGFFDVLAWRETEFLFIEYKGQGDRPNRNEQSWIQAALLYGIQPTQLLVVAYQ